MRKLQTTIAITFTLLAMAPSTMAQEAEKYLLLATTRTGTMQDELNEAGARGYRFADTAARPPSVVPKRSSSWRSIRKAPVSATSCSRRTGRERCSAR